MKQALIFGAGKIARGFIGQLLYLSGFEITFVDVYKPIVDRLNELGSYHVHVLGDESLDSDVTGITALTFDEPDRIYDAFWKADAVFVSVGGKNLPAVGESVAAILARGGIQDHLQNIVVCENWKDAASTFERAVLEHLGDEDARRFEEHVGVSEAVLMRTATQPDERLAAEHPEDVWVQSYWHLPIDRARLKAPFPEVKCVELLDDFGNFLTQKMYTNNTSNAVIAYNAYLLGYDILAEAANSPEISRRLDCAYEEINDTLVAALGVSRESQEAFSQRARAKYCDYTIVDKITRHAKDPIRKLGPADRLVAPCRMAIEHGIEPKELVHAIACALFFDAPGDESAAELAAMRREHGIPYVLEHVCKLDRDEPLYRMVLDAVEVVRAEGLAEGHE